jgi:hypothetical protein
MAKRLAPHPTLSTPRLRLRQFRAEDTDAMHECFANPEAMGGLVHRTGFHSYFTSGSFSSLRPSVVSTA